MRARVLLVAMIGIGLFACLSFAQKAEADGKVKLKVGYFDFDPFYYTNEKGMPEGSIIDLVKEVFSKAGYDYEIIALPAGRLYPSLADGSIDVWPGIKGVGVHKGTTLVTDYVLTYIELRSYNLKGNPPIKAKEDLAGKTVIIPRGYNFGGLITYLKDPMNRIQLAETNTHEAAFRMLEMKRGDYLLDYSGPATKVLKTLKTNKFSYSVMSSIPVYFIISQKTPGAEKIKRQLDKAFLKQHKGKPLTR